MENSLDSPKAEHRKMSLFAGAKAYLGGSVKKMPIDISKELARGSSESALITGKTSARAKALRTSPASPKDRKSSTSRRSPDDKGAPDDPQTPRAKQKIRRASISGTTGNPVERPRRDAASVAGSDVAVSPTKRIKEKRGASLGPLKGERNRGDASVRSREPRASSKEKKIRTSSLGPLQREGSKRPSRLTSPKSRTTVLSDGKIRRVKKSEGDNGSDDEDAKSKQSSSSRRSKMSTKSSGTRKSVSKRSKDKDGTSTTSSSKKLKSPKSLASSRSDLSCGSDHSEERSSRADRSARSARRAGKRTSLLGDMSEQVSIPPLTEGSEPQPQLPSEMHASAQRTVPDIANGFDDAFEVLVLGKINESKEISTESLLEEVAMLNKKITEMNEDSIKAQFAAQSEAARLRKELREEKLELQRSQTERRELRAELKERDLIIDESGRKIHALEKAVESQLDKVDDLEEELRRANEEIFDLEGKLGEMEKVLAESSAVETNALQKEKDFDEKRIERMQRRLEEREMELEKKERKLREARDAMVAESQPQREIEQLEQDNRMLLKALNREKEEAADKLKERDEEFKRLQQELKLAKMESYSQVVNGSTDENIAKLLRDNVDLQYNFNEAKEEASAALKAKNETIASLEEQLKNRLETGKMNGTADNAALAKEIEILKGEFLVMKSKLEGAQRRNQLLEEDIDHWKSVNCNLEDEVGDLKSQVATWRAKHDDYSDGPSENFQDSETKTMSYAQLREPSAAEMAMGRRDDDDNRTTVSESANSIANLWSKLTTPTSKRRALDSDSINEVLARTTFH